MNVHPVLWQILRARAETSGDPALQALLTEATTDSSGATLPSTQDLLSQLESAHPAAGIIARLLAPPQTATAESSLEETETGETATPALTEQHLALEQYERLAHIVRRLGEQVIAMRTELTQLRTLNDTLAAALGACYVCWGTDADCPVCSGAGSPGAALPDERLFAQFVVPALRALQTEKLAGRSGR